ncbi:MAG: acyl-CoA dehydrogenase C-terminal domain-containing protein, partial [Pseudolabrys sp.]
LFGLVALGYMWARIAEAALAKGDDAAMKAKLVTARFFMERMLPETAAHVARIQSGAASTMELADEAF